MGDQLEPVCVDTGLHERRGDLVGLTDAVVLEPVGEFVLAVGRFQDAQRRCLGNALRSLVLELDQRFECGLVEKAGGKGGELLPPLGHALSERRGSAHGCRGRVVQLVGESGGAIRARAAVRVARPCAGAT